MPALRGFRRGYCSIDAEMKAAFREYTGGVSFEGMPFSLESACLLWSLCEVTSPKRILDMGSGFSSYVYRRYQASARMKPEVWSVDESEEWLEKTREYLVSHELSDDNLFYLGDFQALEPGGFDLISLDLGPLEERPDIFEKLVALLNPEGLILLDDMHGAEYRIEIARRLKAHDLVVGYSVRWLTLDKFLRYCLLVRGRSGTPGS
jgi:predicted O-methyltransferase YrrM